MNNLTEMVMFENGCIANHSLNILIQGEKSDMTEVDVVEVN